jgi:type VII secretion protein EccE
MTTTAGPRRAVLHAHRRPSGPSVGPVPLAGIVVVEVGLAVALALVAVDRGLLPVAGIVLSLALLVGLLRVRGRWLTAWIGLAIRFRLRARVREAEQSALDDSTATGTAGDPRLRLLRLLTGDLTVAHTRDHDGRDVGLVAHGGAWSAVLALDPADPDGAGGLLVDEGESSFPLGALAGCLTDRGVVLDALSAVWHCRPGGADLDDGSPAVAAYREILGPLPPVARREAWLVVRLDPARCPAAVAERGGGVVGAQRAVVGALARIGRVLVDHGLVVRPLTADEVLDAATIAADVDDPRAAPGALPDRLEEHWGAVVVGEVGHAAYAMTSWPTGTVPETLTALTGTTARSVTLALTLEPDPGAADTGERTGATDGPVGLRGTVRLTAATPGSLTDAGLELADRARGIGVGLDPLDGQHAAGLGVTLPLGVTP